MNNPSRVHVLMNNPSWEENMISFDSVDFLRIHETKYLFFFLSFFFSPRHLCSASLINETSEFPDFGESRALSCSASSLSVLSW